MQINVSKHNSSIFPLKFVLPSVFPMSVSQWFHPGPWTNNPVVFIGFSPSLFITNLILSPYLKYISNSQTFHPFTTLTLTQSTILFPLHYCNSLLSNFSVSTHAPLLFITPNCSWNKKFTSLLVFCP